MPLTRIDSAFLDLDNLGGIIFDEQQNVPTFKVDATTHRVGIGHSTPVYKLDVVGDTNISSGSNYLVGGSQISTANVTEHSSYLYYTDARARNSIGITDSGGDGSLSYNSSTGVITYTGPSAANVRAHFSAGAGISITSGSVAVVNSIGLTGTPTAPTAAAGTNTTQIATTAFVSTGLANLVDSAPGTLDTLNELAAALGDDANFSTTITNSIATKLSKSGGQMTGNITFSGSQTVDGRDVSADGTKLDGIESNATADQTAAEILTAIKTVDGSGSGLDADTLDGIQSADIAKYNDYAAYDTVLQDSGFISYYALTTGAKPATGNYWSGIQSVLYNDKKFGWQLVGQSQGNITEDLYVRKINNNTYGSWSRIWTAASDGSGSGLDADLLDGQQGSYYLDYDNFTDTPLESNLQGSYKDYQILLDFGSDVANSERRIISASLANVTYSTIGFQIDVVDNEGNHAPSGTSSTVEKSTYYVNCARADGTTLNSPDIVTIKGPTGGDLIRARKVSTGNYEITCKNTAQWREYRINVKVVAVHGTHTITYRNGDTPSTAAASYTSSSSSTNIDFFQSVNADSYFGGPFVGNSTLATFDPPGGGTGQDTATNVAFAFERGDRIVGYVDGYITSMLEWSTGSEIIIGQSGTSLVTGINLKPGVSGNAKVNDNTIWHAGNDGSGSGLDADTVDGIGSGSFLRSDANDYKTGGFLRFNDNLNLQMGTDNDISFFYNGSDFYMDFQTAGDSWYIRDSGDNAVFGFSDSGNLSLYKGDLNVGDGGDNSRILIKKADDNVSDHIQFYNGTTRMGEIGCQDTTWLRINQVTDKNIYTPRYIRADNGFFVDGTAKGINGSGNFIGGTIAGASDYGTLLRSDAADTASSRVTFTSGNNTSANVTTGSLGAIEINQATAQKDAFMTFHISGDYAGYFGLDGATNDLFWGGWSVGATKHKIWHAGNDGSGSGLDADTVDGVDSSQIPYGSNSTATTNTNPTATLKSGFYDINQTNAPTSTWYSYINMRHHNAGGNWGHQIAGSFYSTGDIYNRNISNGTFGSWTKIWNAANDGSGSGLDADTVDGIDSGSFLRSDANDSFSGNLTGSGNAYITFGPNSTWGKYSRFGGNGYAGDANTTSVSTTNGNLHIDASTTAATYLNYYAGTAGVAFGSGASGIVAFMGPDGDLWKGSSDNSGSKYWHAGNDGAGSGLDADTLDGVNSGSFLRSDAADTSTATYTFSNASTSIKIDFAGHAGAANYNYFMRAANDGGSKAVHFVNGSARTADGGPNTYTIRNDGGPLRLGKSSYSTLIEGSGDLTYNSNEVWHAGNDGAGSGLDADTLDGVNLVNGAATANTVAGRNSAGDIFMRLPRTTYQDQNTISGGLVYRVNNSTDNYLRVCTDAAAIRTFIGAAPSVSITQSLARYTGWVPAYSTSDESTVTWNYTENTVEIKNLSGDTSVGAAYKAIKLKAGQKARINVQAKGSVADTDGFYLRLYFYNGTSLPNGKTHVSHNATHPLVQEDSAGDTGWHENGSISTSYVSYSRDYTAGADGYLSIVILNWTGYTGSIYVKEPVISIENNWHPGNDGSGSGLDADTVDGIQGASFLRSDAVDTSTQRISFQANATSNWDTIATGTGSQGSIEVFNTGAGNDAFMSFHTGGDYALYFGLDADTNSLAVGGWSMGANKYKIWHAGNDGSGSGLDADLLDGINSGSFLRSDAADTATGTLTVRDIKLTAGYHLQRSDHHSGHLEGSYNNVGANSAKSNPIYTIGSSYNPSDAALGNMYGIGYTNNNATFINFTGSSGWGMYVAADGDARVWLDGSSGAIAGTGNVIAYASDGRLKTNIETINNPIEKIKKIRGVTFDWIDDITSEYDFHPAAKHETGVIAQEIQEVIPDAVVTAPFNGNYTAKSGTDHNFLTVDKEKIIPLLIEAIKDQQKQIDELKAKLENK